MIWADRVALLIALFLMVITLLLAAGRPAAETLQNPVWWSVVWNILLYAVLPVWGTLRVIDLIMDGPRRRRGKITATLLR